MSCWRILQLSEKSTTIPQLLIKTQFDASSYSVLLTDLTNIWSEDLELPGVVRRVSDVESPIEVSERDTSQLATLFDHVQKSLSGSIYSTATISKDKLDNVVLHTSVSLPEPLDSLTWKFHLVKGTAAALKNELILPLLLSSHIQHKRTSSLLSVISDKDRAITRLVDQYESSNLDLAAAFPSIGNAKSGKRVVRREQAARHIPGLQNFDPVMWKRETAGMVDTDVSTLDLFQEALSECTSIIPPKLKAGDDENYYWWEHLESSMSKSGAGSRAKIVREEAAIPPRAPVSDSETEEEETEDEFETHDNFKVCFHSFSGLLTFTNTSQTRGPAKNLEPFAIHGSSPTTALQEDDTTIQNAMYEDQDGDEDEDLDAPPKVQSQSRGVQSRSNAPSSQATAPTRASPMRNSSPPAKPKAKGFRIGGRTKQTESPSVASDGEKSTPQPQNEGVPAQLKAEEPDKPAKKNGFKIGGRAKQQTPTGVADSQSSEGPSARRSTSTITQRDEIENLISTITQSQKQNLPMEEEREETEEEKVERKRRELKRKNEELAKKQAQSKKKKRF